MQQLHNAGRRRFYREPEIRFIQRPRGNARAHVKIRLVLDVYKDLCSSEYKLQYGVGVFVHTCAGFIVTFKRPDLQFNSYQKRMGLETRVTEKATTQGTVEKTVEKIVLAIKENPNISMKELEVVTGLSRRGIEWNIRKLREDGVIKRIGPDKGGHWICTQPL